MALRLCAAALLGGTGETPVVRPEAGSDLICSLRPLGVDYDYEHEHEHDDEPSDPILHPPPSAVLSLPLRIRLYALIPFRVFFRNAGIVATTGREIPVVVK